jgi:hypothetical protein
VSLDAGHYESFYLKATRPGGGRAAWIRHTIHKRPGEQPTASLWLTLFDADSPGPRAGKQTFESGELSTPTGVYVAVGSALLGPGRALGALACDSLSASWDLSFADESEPFFHLPYKRLYGSPLPRTKFLTPYPSALFEGALTVDDERIEMDGWRGMVGHNWGSEHAERWIWIQGNDLGGEAGSYIDIAAGRIKVGPVTTPWVANGGLRLDGEERRLGGFDRIFSTRVNELPTGCELEISGRGVKVRAKVSSEPRNFVAWLYADPDGPEHNTLNCSISDLDLELKRRGGEPERLEVSGGAAYEIGMRDTDHGIPLQPYPDG